MKAHPPSKCKVGNASVSCSWLREGRKIHKHAWQAKLLLHQMEGMQLTWSANMGHTVAKACKSHYVRRLQVPFRCIM